MSSNKIKIILLLLITLNVISWSFVLFRKNVLGNEIFFLDVGQADSELVSSEGAKFLIDAGADRKIISELEKTLPSYKKRVDVAFISHGQQDHAGGLLYLINNFSVGIVLYNGDQTPLWQNIKLALEDKKIPFIVVSAGDSVSYKGAIFDVLWPDSLAKEIGSNDNSMVIRYHDSSISSLFTADISSKVETYLIKNNINSDILKVPHHGSKFSSSQSFMEAVSPKLAVVEVGKNSYGHPTKEALSRIIESGAKIFRTDLDGIIKIVADNGIFRIFKIAN
jgi:competence protein ComEC